MIFAGFGLLATGALATDLLDATIGNGKKKGAVGKGTRTEDEDDTLDKEVKKRECKYHFVLRHIHLCFFIFLISLYVI